MAKSTDWLILPIFRNAYPQHIYEKAKMVGFEPSEIAKNEGVQPGRTLLKAIPYDMLDLIIDVEQSDEDENITFVMFADEEMTGIMVMWPIEKFIKVLDSFMNGEPKYRKIQNAQTKVEFVQIPYPPNSREDETDE